MTERTVLAPEGYEAWSVAARAAWVLAQLRQQPGETATHEGGTWHMLEDTSSLVRRIQGWMPALTNDQATGVNERLKRDGDRVSVQLGRTEFQHYISLDPDAVEAQAHEHAPVTAEELHEAGIRLLAVAEELSALRQELADEKKGHAATNAELDRVNAELAAARTELETLRAQKAAGHVASGQAAVVFRSGLTALGERSGR